jgi:YYY domain-containing protein
MQTILIWFLTIELLGIPGTAVLNRVFRDRRLVFGLAKPFGFLIFTYVLWLAGMLGASLDEQFVTVVFALIVLSSILSLVFNHGKEAFLYFSPRLNLAPLILYIFVIFCFMLARLVNPEIFWGEKPMDFGFLNYFIRTESLPPEDVWASGQKMNYYYFGSFAFALIHKLSGIDSAIGYNLSIATIAGFFASTSYSLFYLLGLRQRAWCYSLLLMFSANLMILFESFYLGTKLDSHLFWKTTRVYTSPSFAEFPLWSFLFADLHAHVIAMPFCLLLICLSKRLSDYNARVASIAPLCFVWGCLAMINAWDFLAGIVLIGLILLVREYQIASSSSRSNGLTTIIAILRAATKGATLAALALLIFLPNFYYSSTSSNHGWGFIPPSQSNNAAQLFSMHGQWLILLILCIPLVLKRASGITLYRHLSYLIVTSLAVACWVILQHNAYSAPWDILVFVLIIYSIAHYKCEGDSSDIASLAIIAACFLLLLSEVVFVADRMNTIFKFHTIAWILLGVGVLKQFGQTSISPKMKGITYIRTVSICCLPIAGLLLLYIYFFTRLHWTIPGGIPTLNGLAYLERQNPKEADLIYWMRDTIRGEKTIVEASGPSYGGFARISSLTGLKSVLGWKHHVRQRGTSQAEINARSQAIREIYTSTNLRSRLRHLRHYNVDYLVYSKLEYETYGSEGKEQLLANPAIFEVRYMAGDNHLFQIKRTALEEFLNNDSSRVIQ